GMLAELAAARPVLLILEDLHWADRSTRDLVTFLSRVLHRERVAVVGTYRTDDLHRRHPLRAVVAELLRLPSVASIELGPLSYADMAEHLSALSQAPIEAAVLHRMVSRAEGNAYYAEELLAAGGSTGGGYAAADALPTGLAALLIARVEQLSPTAQQVLRAAAVAGRRMEDDIVREASGLAAAEYEEAVREAVTHQMLVPDGGQGYAFRHALIREAIYGDLLPGERTRLHARLAELLAGEDRLGTVPRSAAGPGHPRPGSPENPGAFTASVRAAQEAERLAAPAEAHRHYDAALALWARVSEPEKLAGLDHGTLAYQSAIAAAHRGDAEQAARAAVDTLPADPPRPEYARALATHAQTLMYAGDYAAAASRAEQVRAAARAAGAPWVEADALGTMGLPAQRAGQPAAAIELLTMAHLQACDAQMLGVELRAAFQLARVQLERGDIADASTTAHQGLLRAESAGPGLAPYGLDLQYMHYLAHFADGWWDPARELADGFGIRVTTAAEARLSAMALFIDVARGNASVAERRVWLEPFWPSDRFAGYTAPA